MGVPSPKQDWAGPPGGGRLTPPDGHPVVGRDPRVWAWPPPRPVRTSVFACAEQPVGRAYHRSARTSRFRWWMPPLTVLVFAILLGFLWLGIEFSATLVAIMGGSGILTGPAGAGAVASLAFGLSATALLIPIVLFLVRVIQWRRVGPLLSVEGRLRWGWLAYCLTLAIVLVALCLSLYRPLSAVVPGEVSTTAVLQDPEFFVAAMVAVLCVVPFQATAEEMTLRGLVMQLVGSLGGESGTGVLHRLLRSPWPAILAGGTLFAVVYAAFHPNDPWTVASLVVLGVGLAWLTWRTGGLEAAIGLHLVNSLVQYTLHAYQGRISEIGTGAVVGAGLPAGAGAPLGLALTTLQVVLYVALVTCAARRRGVLRVSPVPAR